MLKHSLLFLFAVLIVAGSCTKKPSTVIPEKEIDTVYLDTANKDTSNVDTTFVVNVSDIIAMPVGNANMIIEVMRRVATEKKIMLSLKDVPANVEAKFSRDGGYPDFTSTLMMDFMFQPPGNYPIKIVATPEGGKAKEYTVNLKVDTFKKKDCNTMLSTGLKLTGTTYSGTQYDSTFYFTQTAFYTNPYDGEVYFRNLPLYTDSVANNAYMTLRSTNLADPGNTNAHVRVILNCDSGKITIPEQEVVGRKVSGPANNQNFTIYGEGTIDAKKKTYTIMYYTQPVVPGSPAPIMYTMRGEFSY